MSGYSTAEQVHQEYVDAMGAELGDLYFTLWNECVLLHWKWEEYVALFGTSPERVDILNEAAGAFFWIVQDTLWADVLMHIARLTDPPKSAGKENLTIRRLPMLVDSSLRAELEQLVQACRDKCAFARDWRMRHLAHLDLGLALERTSAKPLASASRMAVKEALAGVATVLNAVEHYYRNSEVWYGEVSPLGNAVNLLHILRDGLEKEAEWRKRIESGTFTKDDLRRPKSV